MDAYLICPETRKLIWLGKPITPEDDNPLVVYFNQRSSHQNHENPLLNKVLWKFLADHAHMDLRIVFSGEYNDDEYQHISTSDVEAEEYVRNWPPE